MTTLDAYLAERLAPWQAADLERRLRRWQPAECAGVGHPDTGPLCLNFCSNDYLGLSQHPALKAAAHAAVDASGTGAGASRLVTGTQPLHLALEADVAAWKQTEAALVFVSGYQANISLLPALAQPGDVIYGDKHNHASLVDGCLLARQRHRGCQFVRYRHADVAHLAHLLEKHQAAPGRHWIVTDTVFSMVGTLAPLSEIDALAQQFGAWLVVDEAHASGLYGPRRSGLCEALGVRPAVQMGTFSKALGSMGAYVAGSAVCMHWLVQQARGFVFSTAPSPPVVAANRAAVALVQQQPALSEALWRNVAWLHAALAQHFPEGGLPAWGQSPIFCLPMAGNQAALATAAALEADGIFVQAIRPPTVPAACLRVTISATHSGQQLSRLWECLGPRLIGL